MSSNSGESAKTLSEATVQEIQFELIRRSSFNALDGPRVLESLQRHRELWLSVVFDRIGFCDTESLLPISSLIKLRDLPRNIWNAELCTL
jgi:hypothetical protein